MIRIRKQRDVWEVRYRCSGGYAWYACKNLEEVQQTIINTVIRLHCNVKLALEVISGHSEIYLYQNGNLIRRKPLGKGVCLTPHLQQQANLETIIHMIETGMWRVRKWKTPECLAEFPEDTWLPEKKVKKNYLILETIDGAFIPSYFERTELM